MPIQSFWTYFTQFVTLSSVAVIIMLIGCKMGKLGLLERMDIYNFDFYEIPFLNVVIMVVFFSIIIIVVYLLLVYSWFGWIYTVVLSVAAFLLSLFLFVDIIDWTFGIEEANEFVGSGHILDRP